MVASRDGKGSAPMTDVQGPGTCPPQDPGPGAGGPGWRDFPPLDLPLILRVALRQIVEHGYEGTTVRGIAREVGVTVPALYYHFENKQAILTELLDRAMAIVRGHVDAALAEADDDPVARLTAIVEAIVLYMTNHRDLAFLDAERRSLTPANLARYVGHRDRLERELREVIEEGSKRGDFGTDDPASCGRAILSMCQGVAGWYHADGPSTPDDVASRYARIALGAVERVPPAGRGLGRT
jgi:AcrR family transcriptional regulator